MRYPTYLILLFCSTTSLAQKLVPVPGTNGTYGFANTAGKLVTQPQFKKAWLPNEQGLALASDSSQNVRVIRQDGVVLPASIQYKAWNEPVAEVATTTTSISGQPDTVPGFFCLRSSDWQEFLLVKNGKNGWETRKYLSFEKLKSPVPVYGNYVNENYITGPFTFFHGLHRVIKGERKVNFINTDLKEIFPQDYVNGSILKNGYIAVASPEGKFALADEKGKFRTGFVYRNIIGAMQPDRFVVNHIPGQHHTRNVGLIDADGRVVIDTVYMEMTAISEKWLLARKKDFYGVIDYAGNTVLPFEYGILEYTQGGIFIASKEFSGFNLITIEGKPVLENTCSKIEYRQNWTSADQSYYIITPEYNSPVRTLLTANLDLMVSDTIRTLEGHYGNLKVTGPRGMGLYDLKGKNLIPTVYQEIERQRDTSGFLVMRSDSLFGFYSMDGQEVLPCKYTRIVPEKGPDGTILWANTHRNKNLYTPFTLKGERLPIPDQIAPTLRVVDFKNCFVPDMVRGRWQLTLPDGSIVYKPQEYPYNNINIGTPDGCLMLEKDNDNYKILDAYLNPINPKGYFLPQNRYKGPYVKWGLIPVFNNAKQSGIINTRGEWVQKPTAFEYHILRPNMYSEHKGQPQEHNPQGAKVYSITPDGTKSVEVHYISDKFRNGYLIVGRLFDDAPQNVRYKKGEIDGRVMKYAFMDTLGNVLTPFCMAQFPWNPKGNRWFAEIYESDYSTKNVVFDYTGRMVFDFGKEPVSNYDPENHWVYVTDSLNRTGIRDTLGREILPIQYMEFNWYGEPGTFFQSKLPDGKRQLCSGDGKVVLSGFQFLMRLETLPDGYFFVVTDHTSHILSPDKRVLCSLPGKEMDLVPAYPNLIRVKTDEYVIRYVDFRKGTVYQ
ncbi:MAG: WG repeat-containing protein [Saprospiraceae bacterium]|nr:WG repeat-containing protein [Saprospiraceae bacterium]